MSRFCGLSVILVIATLAVMAGPLAAQPASTPPAGPAAPKPPAGAMKANSVELVKAEPVQKELKLTDEQKQKIKDATETFQKAVRTEYAALRDIAPDDPKLAQANEKLGQLHADHLKELQAILTPEQADQLKSLSDQLSAWMIANNPQAAVDLALTDQQKKQLNQIREEVEAQVWQSARDAAKKAFDVLTPEQRVKLEEMPVQPARAPGGPVLRTAPRRPGSAVPAPSP